MADVKRSLADLLLLFADNTTGDISPQDLRDLAVSLSNAHGRISIDTPAATTIGVAGTFVKAAGSTVASGIGVEFTEGTANRLTYTGTPTRHVHMTANLTLNAIGTNQVVSAAIAVNGVVQSASEAATIIKVSGDGLSLSLAYDLHMTTNDYVEVWVTNETSTGDVTVENLYFHAAAMFAGV